MHFCNRLLRGDVTVADRGCGSTMMRRSRAGDVARRCLGENRSSDIRAGTSGESGRTMAGNDDDGEDREDDRWCFMSSCGRGGDVEDGRDGNATPEVFNAGNGCEACWPPSSVLCMAARAEV